MTKLKVAAETEISLKGQLEEYEVKYDNLLLINKEQELKIDIASKQAEASLVQKRANQKTTHGKKGWLMRVFFTFTVPYHCNPLNCCQFCPVTELPVKKNDDDGSSSEFSDSGDTTATCSATKLKKMRWSEDKRKVSL